MQIYANYGKAVKSNIPATFALKLNIGNFKGCIYLDLTFILQI